MSRRIERLFQAALLLLGLGLGTSAADHALPGVFDAAPDGLHPALTLDALRHPFGGRILPAHKYPLFGFWLFGLAGETAVRLRWGPSEGGRRIDAFLVEARRHLDALSRGRGDALAAHAETISTAIVGQRLLSALAHAAALLALFRLARLFFGAASAAMAALLVAASWPFVYYAHQTNVEALYLALTLLALLAAARAVTNGSRRALARAAVLAALAGGVKEPAFGVLLPAAAATLFLYVRPGPLGERPRRPFPLLAAAGSLLLALVLYGLSVGLPFDPEFARGHFAHIFGPGVETYRTLPPGLRGRAILLCDFALGLRHALGTPWLVLALAGCFVAVRRRGRAAFFFLAPALGYLLLFQLPVGYTYLRFTLPVALLLAPFAAALAVRSARLRRVGPLFLLAAVALLAARMYQSVRLVEMLRADPRPEARRWLEVEAARLGVRTIGLVQQFPAHGLTAPAGLRTAALGPGSPPDAVPPLVAVSTFDPPEGCGRSEAPAPDPPERFRLAGVPLRRVAVFAPAGAHPARRAVLFQPTIAFYRREGD